MFTENCPVLISVKSITYYFLVLKNLEKELKNTTFLLKENLLYEAILLTLSAFFYRLKDLNVQKIK